MPKKKGRWKKGDPSASVRSRWLGYDCYLGGQVDDVGFTNCYLRNAAIPPYITDPLRSQLPKALRWPARDADAAHRMISAIYDLDTKELVGFLREFPQHQFGFEEFLCWAERRVVTVGKKAKFKTTEWPASTKIVDRTKVSATRWEGLTLDFNVIRYHDGDAWGEVVLRDAETTLTRALVDLRTNRFQVTHHYPGRYQARRFYLPLLKQVFGSRAPGKHLVRPIGTQRKILSPDPVR